MFYTSFISHTSKGWKNPCSRFWSISFHVRVLFMAYVLVTFSLHSHMAFPWCVCTEEKWESALCSLFLWNQGSVFIASFNYFLRSPNSSTITLGIMASIYIFSGGHKYSVHNSDWCQFSDDITYDYNVCIPEKPSPLLSLKKQDARWRVGLWKWPHDKQIRVTSRLETKVLSSQPARN